MGRVGSVTGLTREKLETGWQAREENDQRIVLAFFAFYRLPEDLQAQFALNTAAWLVGR